MSNGEESHPLLIHAIVLFLVAALLLTMGAVGAVQVAKAEGLKIDAKSAAEAAREAERLKRATTGVTGGAPTSASDAGRRLQDTQRLGEQVGGVAARARPFVVPILMIIWGLATGAAGLFLLKRAEWARFAGIALVAGTLACFTWLMSVANSVAGVDFQVWRPLALIAIAGLCGKFLWDMAMEKIVAPATAR